MEVWIWLYIKDGLVRVGFLLLLICSKVYYISVVVIVVMFVVLVVWDENKFSGCLYLECYILIKLNYIFVIY